MYNEILFCWIQGVTELTKDAINSYVNISQFINSNNC